MSHLHTKPVRYAKEIYDSIPVHYCKQCLSLKIKFIPGISDTDYCDECNSTNVQQTTIDEWEQMYKQRYGYKFLDKPKY